MFSSQAVGWWMLRVSEAAKFIVYRAIVYAKREISLLQILELNAKESS